MIINYSKGTTLGAESPPISSNQVISGSKHTVKSGKAVFCVDFLVLVGILVMVILFNSFQVSIVCSGPCLCNTFSCIQQFPLQIFLPSIYKSLMSSHVFSMCLLLSRLSFSLPLLMCLVRTRQVKFPRPELEVLFRIRRGISFIDAFNLFSEFATRTMETQLLAILSLPAMTSTQQGERKQVNLPLFSSLVRPAISRRLFMDLTLLKFLLVKIVPSHFCLIRG